ncbi:DUF5334 family protein [Desulfovibrio sp.]|uniref:DUF5334 family protein n=1 Tax=Desulfovibrio sp. TaxID=885 RepID=UPI0025C4B2D3|nr:DUF5334 family protein [Desulfovibrio sp.]MCI7569624.1 DUF5334 domain-containing protein [Desulfovibrio sp.]
MKYLLACSAVAACLGLPVMLYAWDGFDAATAELVEVTPDALPSGGDAVDVRDYATDRVQTCLVENVTRNARTVELSVRTPDGQWRTLVMEGR